MYRFLFALLGFLAVISSPVAAHEIKFGDLTIVHPFARASAGPARAGVAFMNFENAGASLDRLVGITVAEDVAKKAEIHTHVMEGDVAKMRKVEGSLEIPAGGMVKLEPGGLHIMLMKLAEPLEEGSTFMLSLEFEQAGEIMLEIPVLGVSAGTEMKMHDPTPDS